MSVQYIQYIEYNIEYTCTCTVYIVYTGHWPETLTKTLTKFKRL